MALVTVSGGREGGSPKGDNPENLEDCGEPNEGRVGSRTRSWGLEARSWEDRKERGGRGARRPGRDPVLTAFGALTR